ncbi:hypothetical protein MC885_012533 [Smutsia gigantea]|nr:hypothetical protein MC885_012533 [Smutsia gigantea]
MKNLTSFSHFLFFRVVGDGGSISKGRIYSLKAQVILIDMKGGVVNEILQGLLRDVFDSKQLITDISGSGNNWAVGHKIFGSLYQEQILEKLRKSAEECDRLQCFFIIHSMRGGKGSGLGTFLLKVLEDEFPEVYRFVTSVYPSGEDDVIRSSCNSVLAMKELSEHAHSVLPIDNQSLFDIISKIDPMVNSGKSDTTIKPVSLVTSSTAMFKKRQKPFDAMNNIVANLLLSLTMLDQMFSDAFSKDDQLMRADPKHSLYLACALMIKTFSAICLLEPRRLEDQPVFSATHGLLPLTVSLSK